MLSNLIGRAVKLGKSSSWIFALSYFSLFVINLSSPTTMWGQIPVKTNSIPITINRPTLKAGSQGEEVLQLQGVLKLLGYYFGQVDGVYSDTTAAAVVKFQESVGLMPNGIVDQNTWNRLLPAAKNYNYTNGTTIIEDTNSNCNCSQNKTSPATTNDSPPKIESDTETSNIHLPILKIGMRGDAVRGLQQRLKVQGFLKGKVDGVFGPKTQAAVKAAQRKYQQQPNGIVDASLWMTLLR
ncbi:MAG: peptidoglycan-binding protein [Okeania sp. SIO1H6]|nr:peptidoglycan-binding protein [Okeania sp. SIO1H6]